MQPRENGQMQKAIQVRNLLAERYLHLPEVSAIDIGYASHEAESPPTLVVRIHVKDQETLKSLDVPEAVMEIPIQVILSNNQLE